MIDSVEVARKVLGNTRIGRRPHIIFQTIRYTNQQLISRPTLINKTLILTVNPNDIRTLDARLKNGQKLGTLERIGRRYYNPVTLAEWSQNLR